MTLKHTFLLFLSTCGSILLAAITAFFVRLLGQLATVSARERAIMLGTIAADAIRYVAERSAADASNGTKWTSAMKLSAAISYMVRHVDVDHSTAADAIHAALPAQGEGATAHVQ